MSAVLKGEPAAIWRHECPFVGDVEIDENCPAIIDCRCFEGPRFLAAQDAMAVKLDLERGAEE